MKPLNLGMSKRESMKGVDIISSLDMKGEEMGGIKDDAQVSGLEAK